VETPEERSDKIVIETKKGYCWFDCSIYGGREFYRYWTPLAWQLSVRKGVLEKFFWTSMDRDGTKDGYDLELTRTMSENLDIPVIASGGLEIQNIYMKHLKLEKLMLHLQLVYFILTISRSSCEGIFKEKRNSCKVLKGKSFIILKISLFKSYHCTVLWIHFFY